MASSDSPQEQLRSLPQPPLLASLAEFREILEPLILAQRPASLCEIGLEKGLFSRRLLELCRRMGCRYDGIDPEIPAELARDHRRREVTFHAGRSLEVLPELGPHALYVIDGDHNYHTVRAELEVIFGRVASPEEAPMLIFHDVHWPWARRDLYYDPESLPADARHPYSRERGPVPGEESLREWGFSAANSDFDFAAAETQGGVRNGVLTAIEDARSAHGWDAALWVRLPVIFGLGILAFPENLTGEAHAQLERLSLAAGTLRPLLERLEENRIHQHLGYLQAVECSRAFARAYDDLAEHNRRLAGTFDGLNNQFAELNELYRQLIAWAREVERECQRKDVEIDRLTRLSHPDREERADAAG